MKLLKANGPLAITSEPDSETEMGRKLIRVIMLVPFLIVKSKREANLIL